MDDDGGRPPALDCLRAAAHRRFGVTLARRRRRALLPAGLHGGLSDHLPVRSPLGAGLVAKGPGVAAETVPPGGGGRPAGADRCERGAGSQAARTRSSCVPWGRWFWGP